MNKDHRRKIWIHKEKWGDIHGKKENYLKF